MIKSIANYTKFRWIPKNRTNHYVYIQKTRLYVSNYTRINYSTKINHDDKDKKVDSISNTNKDNKEVEEVRQTVKVKMHHGGDMATIWSKPKPVKPKYKKVKSYQYFVYSLIVIGCWIIYISIIVLLLNFTSMVVIDDMLFYIKYILPHEDLDQHFSDIWERNSLQNEKIALKGHYNVLIREFENYLNSFSENTRFTCKLVHKASKFVVEPVYPSVPTIVYLETRIHDSETNETIMARVIGKYEWIPWRKNTFRKFVIISEPHPFIDTLMHNAAHNNCSTRILENSGEKPHRIIASNLAKWTLVDSMMYYFPHVGTAVLYGTKAEKFSHFPLKYILVNSKSIALYDLIYE